MKIRAKNGGQTVDITLPATDMDMHLIMQRSTSRMKRMN